jgi:hypothetical protein
MTTAELEKLILSTADDMRFLLGSDSHVVARWGNVELRTPGDNVYWSLLWHKSDGHQRTIEPTEIALAALVEFWRDRLEKEHHVFLTRDIGTVLPYAVFRAGAPRASGTWLSQDGTWQRVSGFPSYSYPEAIVAAIHAVAKEKRKEEKPAPAPPTSPSPAAVRAAERVINHFKKIVDGLSGLHLGCLPEIIAREIDQEFAKDGPPSLDFLCPVCGRVYILAGGQSRRGYDRLVCKGCYGQLERDERLRTVKQDQASKDHQRREWQQRQAENAYPEHPVKGETNT